MLFDLAAAVVIGAVFGALITSFVANILTPLLAALVAKRDFSALRVNVSGATIAYGTFLNASFLLIGAAVYFFIVAPMNAWKARSARQSVPADPTTRKCPDCLSDILIAARRCAFCSTLVTESPTTA